MSQWFHARDGRQQGPVTEGEIRDLVDGGGLGPEDLVWCEGMPEWVPVRTLAQFTPRPDPAIPQPPLSTNPYQAPPSSMAEDRRFATRGGDIDVGEALALGWNGFVQNFWLGSLIVLLAGGIGLMAGLVGSVIPLLGPLAANLLVAAPLTAGCLYAGILAADNARGSSRALTLEDLFSAYSRNFAHVILCGLITMLASLATAFGTGLMLALLLPGAIDNAALMVVVFLVVLTPWCYLGLRVTFWYQFLMERRLGVIQGLLATWGATRGQVLALLLLALTYVGLALAGTLLLFVGLIPAFFLVFCITGAAYRQVAGD
jgi:hypothetical protein